MCWFVVQMFDCNRQHGWPILEFLCCWFVASMVAFVGCFPGHSVSMVGLSPDLVDNIVVPAHSRMAIEPLKVAVEYFVWVVLMQPMPLVAVAFGTSAHKSDNFPYRSHLIETLIDCFVSLVKQKRYAVLAYKLVLVLVPAMLAFGSSKLAMIDLDHTVASMVFPKLHADSIEGKLVHYHRKSIG